jgi:hypothetical protein
MDVNFNYHWNYHRNTAMATTCEYYRRLGIVSMLNSKVENKVIYFLALRKEIKLIYNCILNARENARAKNRNHKRSVEQINALIF